MSLTLKDLRVHFRPENGLPRQIKQRPVTIADIVEVLKSEGALAREAVPIPVGRRAVEVPWPGRYLVFRLDEEEK